MNIKEQIHNNLIQVRSDYYGLGLEMTYPMDVGLLLESYGIDIVPTANLERDFGVDTVLTADMKTIHVDMDRMMDSRYDTRLRFSLAHELGHIRLHSNHFGGNVQTISKSSVRNYHYVLTDDKTYDMRENQAHEFAGQLLVPQMHLKAEVARQILINLDILYDSEISVKQLLSGMTPKLTRVFGVSSKVIERRIMAEGLIKYFELNSESCLNQVSKPELIDRLNVLLSRQRV